MYQPTSFRHAIEVDGLSKTYNGSRSEVLAVNGVSFHVEAGEIFGLLGPNGAGKSTTMLVLATLLAPSAGRVRIFGRDLDEEAVAIRETIGVALQDTGLDEAQSGRRLLTLVGRLHGFGRDAARRRADELLELVGLLDAADRRVSTYSGGMRRRIDLALALVHHPRLVMLDEPTTGLDPAARRSVWQEIEALRESGVTVLLTTQYLDEADRLCDRLAIIERGSIVAEGAPAELKRSLGGDVIEIEMHAPQDAVAAAAAFGTDASVHGATVRLPGRDGRRRLPEVVLGLQQQGLEPAGLAVVEPTLDDVFFELTASSKEGSS